MKEKIKEEIGDTWNNPVFKIFSFFIVILFILIFLFAVWESGCRHSCPEGWDCGCGLETFLGK